MGSVHLTPKTPAPKFDFTPSPDSRMAREEIEHMEKVMNQLWNKFNYQQARTRQQFEMLQLVVKQLNAEKKWTDKARELLKDVELLLAQNLRKLQELKIPQNPTKNTAAMQTFSSNVLQIVHFIFDNN